MRMWNMFSYVHLGLSVCSMCGVAPLGCTLETKRVWGVASYALEDKNIIIAM